jgi:biopolymer transport protein ExbB/TolQ
MSFFVDAMAKGGEFMYPILLCAIFALAIAVERMYYVMFRANINGTAFMAQVQKLIMANNIDRAIKLCNAEPNAALPRVLKAGFTRVNCSEVEI